MFLSLKTLYRKRTVIWPFYFYTIIRTLSKKITGTRAICFYSKEWYIFVGGGLLERSRYDRCCKNADRKVSRKFKSIYCS
ncbi:hypothetical protein BXA51_10725 [Enterococcus faecium]|nr:hypothetical protein BXA51_10725 [Enterococcus faecium]